MLQIGVNEPVFLELSHLKTHINVAAGAALQQSVPNAFCFVSHARFRFCLHYILQTFGNLSCSGPFLPAVLLPGMAFWWQASFLLVLHDVHFSVPPPLTLRVSDTMMALPPTLSSRVPFTA